MPKLNNLSKKYGSSKSLEFSSILNNDINAINHSNYNNDVKEENKEEEEDKEEEEEEKKKSSKVINEIKLNENHKKFIISKFNNNSDKYVTNYNKYIDKYIHITDLFISGIDILDPVYYLYYHITDNITLSNMPDKYPSNLCSLKLENMIITNKGLNILSTYEHLMNLTFINCSFIIDQSGEYNKIFKNLKKINFKYNSDFNRNLYCNDNYKENLYINSIYLFNCYSFPKLKRIDNFYPFYDILPSESIRIYFQKAFLYSIKDCPIEIISIDGDNVDWHDTIKVLTSKYFPVLQKLYINSNINDNNNNKNEKIINEKIIDTLYTNLPNTIIIF
jgi:hypothetical protein